MELSSPLLSLLFFCSVLLLFFTLIIQFYSYISLLYQYTYTHTHIYKMDGLVGKIFEKVMDKESGSEGHHQQEYGSYGGGGYGSAPPPGPPPPEGLPYPWVGRWDERERRWYYVNEQTGQTTWERPYGGGGPSGYPPQQGYGYGQEGYRGEGGYGQPQGYGGGYGEPQYEKKDNHTGLKVAGGVAAGALGGALLMHEGDEIGKFFVRSLPRYLV